MHLNRFSASAALLLCLALAAAARADSVTTSEMMLPHESRPTYIGIGVDGGAPGGAGFTLLVRPLSWLRLNAGLAYNVAGFGYRAGVAFSPWQWAVTPTLNLDAGQYLSGDFTKFVSVSDPNVHALLSNTTYSFATAQIGLEFGSQRRFVFYLRGGLAYFESTLPADRLDAIAAANNPDPSNSFKTGDAKFSAVTPCASLGFNLFIY